MSTRRPIPLFERLQIESHAFCNRDCWFCPRTYDRSGRYLDAAGEPVRARMTTGRILDVLDQAVALGFRGLVGFHHYSEPLLDRRRFALAAAARERGLRPYLHTNGDVLRKSPALCREVEAVYEHVVVGLYDHTTPEELAAAESLWRTLLPKTDLQFSAIGRNGAKGARSMGVPRALVPPDARMGVPDLSFPNGPCNRPLARMIIQYDGTMCHCCDDDFGAFELGNVHESTLEELWYSDRHVRVVSDLLDGRRDRYALCRACPASPTSPRADGERVRMRRRTVAAASAPPAAERPARVASPVSASPVRPAERCASAGSSPSASAERFAPAASSAPASPSASAERFAPAASFAPASPSASAERFAPAASSAPASPAPPAERCAPAASSAAASPLRPAERFAPGASSATVSPLRPAERCAPGASSATASPARPAERCAPAASSATASSAGLAERSAPVVPRRAPGYEPAE